MQSPYEITTFRPKPGRRRPTCLGLALLGGLLAGPETRAQTPPDAGQILQQSQPETIAPRSSSMTWELGGDPLVEEQDGGQQITLSGVRFEGNTRFSDEALKEVIHDLLNEPLDLAGLRHLANQVSRYYRQQGYLFARAFLPAQSLDDGVLTLRVLEGRYGQAEATSDDAALADAARPYLAPLATGRLIESAPLERQLLLLGDLPGLSVTPIMRPGAELGQGDLEVRVGDAERLAVELGADNHGSRFSGEYRARATLAAHRVLSVGDELNLSALYTNEATWLGNISYSRPLGANGLRGEVGYAHTDYTLGRGFEGYTGTAAVYSATLSYPLLRSQQANVSLSARYQYKDLDDNIDFADYRKATESHGLPLGVRFDARDGLGRGGITFGTLAVTPGTLEQSQTSMAESNYGFTKLNLNVARVQSLGHGLDLYGRLNAQWADRDDLDGSESIYLGGPYGVRAFPTGEGSDSRGWLAQMELRYRASEALVPYLFYDLGHTPNGGLDSGDSRSLAGTGMGLRYQHAGFHLDISSAWEVRGGDALSDNHQRDPRIWATAAYRF
ncbi:ShlB/FhaC/HecB family hemolysin secretion/activation protein [Halomonas organivorans]|uniref:Hemolysin activation/secretion protein n=1 Tax=Halomonas organivorans TaxID=257772 RepID=A0A7W5C209_9GAMM|nr:ShlB/FhaC/HecB family hemolysin secretion/activation protein [Halomonas organivorans]MBB3143182.1 hemolysin activation/secretion protein [Halomonas organivorans]